MLSATLASTFLDLARYSTESETALEPQLMTTAATPERPRLLAGERLSSQDASFLYSESFSGPTHIAWISVFEGQLEFERLVEFIDRRLHLLPRYRQRVMAVPFNLAHATWEDDPSFDLLAHVHRHALPGWAALDDAFSAAVTVHEPPLDRGRPLWELHVFEGVPERTVLLWKVHHCMVDGVSGVELTTVMFDFEPDAAVPETSAAPWQPGPLPSPEELFARAIGEGAATASAGVTSLDRSAEANRIELQAAAARLSDMATRPIAPAPWNTGIVTRSRTFAWMRYDFGDFGNIRTAFGGTVNDIVLTVLGEAAARYLQERSVDGSLGIRIGCPVSVRREEEQGSLGNRVSMMFPLLSGTPTPVTERLAAVSEETARIKAAREAQGLELLAEANTVPPGMAAFASLWAAGVQDFMATLAANGLATESGTDGRSVFGINFAATNIPGVQVPQYLAGHKMLDTVVLIPLSGTVGYSVAICTYNQNLYMGLMAEPRLMPDVTHMKDLVNEVFRELLAAAVELGNAA